MHHVAVLVGIAVGDVGAVADLGGGGGIGEMVGLQLLAHVDDLIGQGGRLGEAAHRLDGEPLDARSWA